MYSKVILGFTKPLTEPGRALGRGAIRVRREKKYTHCVVSYTLEVGGGEGREGREVKTLFVLTRRAIDELREHEKYDQ